MTHKALALSVIALLLLQYVPLAAFVIGPEKEAHSWCAHCNGSFCLRHANEPNAHHGGSHGSQHASEATHHTQPAQVAHQHVAHSTTGGHVMVSGSEHAADATPQICGCTHKSPTAPRVVSLDKVVLGDYLETMLRGPDEVRFAAFQTAKPDPFTSEHFHPPRAV